MRPIRERQARAEREVMSAGGREGTGSPAFETAPRLTEWRYRVVDSTRLSGSALLAAGHEFVATGEEEHVGHGWYRLVPGYSTVYRVVRVEPEKAQGVTCRHCGATNSPGADHCAACLGTIDGGGERSGQVDEGPPRVGDVVRGEYIGEREVLAVDDARRRVHLPDQAPDYWHSFEGLTVVRRAGQPEAKAEGALRPGDKGYQPQPSGPPLLDPHAGTVADLVAKVARLENVVLAFWGNGTVSTCYEAVDKIRAERAGRKLWLTRTTSSLAT